MTSPNTLRLEIEALERALLDDSEGRVLLERHSQPGIYWDVAVEVHFVASQPSSTLWSS